MINTLVFNCHIFVLFSRLPYDSPILQTVSKHLLDRSNKSVASDWHVPVLVESAIAQWNRSLTVTHSVPSLRSGKSALIHWFFPSSKIAIWWKERTRAPTTARLRSNGWDFALKKLIYLSLLCRSVLFEHLDVSN